MSRFWFRVALIVGQAALANMPSRPAPWAPSMKPHPKSTRVARACTDLPSLSTSVTTPLANIVYQARCDVSSDDICVPVTMTMAADNGFLAVASMGGWKNRCVGVDVSFFYPFF